MDSITYTSLRFFRFICQSQKVFLLYLLMAFFGITGFLYADDVDYEPDNSYYSANMLDHIHTNRQLYPKENEDWFMFYAAEDTEYTLTINNHTANIAIACALFNSNIVNIFHTTTSESISMQRLNFDHDDLYFLRITPGQQLIIGQSIQYDININNTKQFDLYEPDNVQNNARPIVIDDDFPQYRSFHNQDDIDWLMLYGTKDTIYTIKTANKSSACKYTIEIMNTKKETIGPTEEKEIPFRCDNDQIYYIKIFSSNSNVCKNSYYTIQITYETGVLLNTIEGRILDACSKVPLEQAMIKLCNSDCNRTGISIPGGFFIIANIETCFDCNIIIQKKYYTEYPITIPSLDACKEKDFYIYPKPEFSEVLFILKILSGIQADSTSFFNLSHAVGLLQTIAGLKKCPPK